MEKETFNLLLDELKLQTNFGIYSVNCFNKVISEMNDSKDSENGLELNIKFWYYLQNYVVALGNISKIFNAPRKPRESPKHYQIRIKERKEFSRKLDVTDYPHLLDRDMRNFLEHIDEKVVELSKTPEANIFNRNIFPSNSIVVNGKSLEDSGIKMLRNYITDQQKLVLYGKEFGIKDTLPELLKLRDKIMEVERDEELRS